MKRLSIDLDSLTAQMILGFVVLVLLTAIAVGAPAVWLLRNQIERQAWAQVEQGYRSAQALHEARQGEMAQLATLTAQRPTLHDLLAQGDQASLQSYLRTLQSGAGIDLVLVCDSDEQISAQESLAGSDDLCKSRIPSGYQVISTASVTRPWLIATHPVRSPNTDRQDDVVVGIAMDDEYAGQLRDQTGLEHTFLVDGQPLATSLSGGVSARRAAPFTPLEHTGRGILVLDNQPFYTHRFPLSTTAGGGDREGILEAEVALPVAHIITSQQNLVRTLVASFLVVAAVASILGVFLARRISSPLAGLAEAATTLSQGDLAQAVAVDTRVREVAQVGLALESARIDLNLTLSDLQREKAWTDHLLDAIVEGIVTLDDSGRIIFFSQGAERITGWSRAEALGQTCDDVLQATEIDQPFRDIFSIPGRRQTLAVTLRDGREAILAVTSARLQPQDGEEARLVLVCRDISDIEAVHRMMGHFMANVAHEFRTPLSAVAASIELLHDQAPDLSAAELHELIISLHLGIVGLQTLVDNLLEGASIEAGRFRVSPRAVRLDDIIAEAVQTMQPLLNKYGQRLVIEMPPVMPVVRADSRRTVQVVVNLLSNASKYSPDDTAITISASTREGWVRVSVADQGPGVAMAHRNAVFRRFRYTTSGNDKAQVGMRLGLSVVKAIVEAQGGQVGVEDRPGGGSIFWFTLAVESEA